jgi:hypothetical protein
MGPVVFNEFLYFFQLAYNLLMLCNIPFRIALSTIYFNNVFDL